ncbi:hypothetical protein OVA24_02215 [Luteolibacter sp. SL250]|uniref:surface carbohydrate biosynthesis protein n=1 Tax=Luteolibacter sp. SL250 TaxID=2995170 RepID=UPI00226F172A|nr:surface carbohydrate biosynthesis protein [Luteolibacter sp. SL250]WAC20193.1 hypothetical protein OVA24_02215 [Luteolibacter sp. SL250]
MSLIRRKHVVFFPVEVKVREFDFRLILAVFCARPDWQIILGDHEQLFPITLRLKNAILVLKNVIGGKRPWKYRKYKDLGHRIVQLDEEAGIFEGDKDFWKEELHRRLDIAKMDADDYVCTWGTFQADYYKSLNPACADHIIATGHPRMELGSPRFSELYRAEADRLHARFGDFILINTNLVANNARGIDVLLVSHKVDPANTAFRTRIIEQEGFEIRRAGHFIDLINHLSNEFPDRQIVVRPHPSEDIRRHEALLRFIPRVTVTREGSLYAWLMASSILVHGGCTTAIEAQVVGKPIINFHPEVDERFDVCLPNLLGVTCRTLPEVSSTIREIQASGVVPELDETRAAQLEEILCNLNKNHSGFDLITGIITKCQDESQPTTPVGLPPTLFLQSLRDTLGRFTRSSRLLLSIFHRRDTGEHKFPPLDRREILRKVEIISRITGKQVKVHFHSAKIFSITTD